MSSSGMSIVRLTFLGTSGTAPTLHRNVSGLAVKADTDLLLFDCGEGTQRQMIRYGTGFGVDAVYFTHFHLDHYLGIIGFLRTLAMADRAEPMALYGPAPAKRILGHAMNLGIDRSPFPLEVRELSDGDIVKRSKYQIRAVRVEHSVNALGYVIEEYARHGRFDPHEALRLGVPSGPLFGKLQRGEPVRLEGDTMVQPSQVIGATRRGRKVAISGDTRPCLALRDAAQGADLLVHESTFDDDGQARATEKKHSTAREAGRIAREANVRRLVLTHFSGRHDADPRPLLAQAREEFHGQVDAAFDGLTIELSPADADAKGACS